MLVTHDKWKGRPPLIHRIEKILRYKGMGLTLREIGRIIGIPHTTVARSIKYSKRQDYQEMKRLDSVYKRR